MDLIQFLWLCIPTLYFLIALWSWLEKKGRSVKKQNPGDFFKQGSFIVVAVAAAFVIDIYFLESIVDLLPNLMPLLFYRIVLLPITLFLSSLLIGGSKTQSLKKKTHARRKR